MRSIQELKSVMFVTSHVPTAPYVMAHGLHVSVFHATSAARSSVLFAATNESTLLGAALGPVVGDAEGDSVLLVALVFQKRCRRGASATMRHAVAATDGKG